MADAAFRIRYRPAPPALGSHLEAGAWVLAEGLESAPPESLVIPEQPSDLHDQLGPNWHAAIDEAAQRGADGESGTITVDLDDWLPW